MPFFIPVRTKCAICNQVIDNRFDAAQLPYIYPTVSSSLSQLSRRFVHRSCWREWEHAKLFSTAAFNLVKEGASQDSAIKIEFECDELIVFWVAATNSYRLQDFQLLVILDIPLSETYRMVNHFVCTLSQKNFTTLFLISPYIWKARRLNSDNIEFTVSEQGQIVDKFVVPPHRRSCWVDALEEIIKEASHKVGEIPTVNTSIAFSNEL